MTTQITTYLNNLRAKFKTGKATEYSHRPALEELLETLDSDVQAINEEQYFEGIEPEV